jgi:hypothetical protein
VAIHPFVSVPIFSDAANEPDETFFVNLSSPVNATIDDGQAVGTIINDDPAPIAAIELTHGSSQTRSLGALPGPAVHRDWYRIGQKAYSSYEIVVDSTSANVGPGIQVQRIAPDGVTVLQSASAVSSLNFSQRLSWENASGAVVSGELLRIQSGGCTTTCGPSDVYRVEVHETTYTIPRFNSANGQSTTMFIQNSRNYEIRGTVWVWDEAGTLLTSVPFTVMPKALLTVDISGIAVGAGSITVSHNGGYGGLVGKAVTIEPVTGYTFDAPMVPVVR